MTGETSTRARELPATAFWLAVVGVAALAGPWHTTFTGHGPSIVTGPAAAIFVLVVGVAAAAAFALAWLRPRRFAVIAGSSLAAVGALVCVITAKSGGDATVGFAPWMAGFGLAGAAVTGGLATRLSGRFVDTGDETRDERRRG